MLRDVKNGGYGIRELTEKSHHQHRDRRLREISTMIGGSYTMALVRACDDIIIDYCYRI